jgi:hypothetical protein
MVHDLILCRQWNVLQFEFTLLGNVLRHIQNKLICQSFTDWVINQLLVRECRGNVTLIYQLSEYFQWIANKCLIIWLCKFITCTRKRRPITIDCRFCEQVVDLGYILDISVSLLAFNYNVLKWRFSTEFDDP